jgi:hypothetical protein
VSLVAVAFVQFRAEGHRLRSAVNFIDVHVGIIRPQYKDDPYADEGRRAGRFADPAAFFQPTLMRAKPGS